MQPIGIRAASAIMELEATGIAETVLVIVIVEPVSNIGVIEDDVGAVEEPDVVAGYAQEHMEEIWETMFTAHGWVA